MTREMFLDEIKGDILSLWDAHQILPSLAAAQAVHESDGGTSPLAQEANSLFGIKGGGSCNSSGELTPGTNSQWDGSVGCYMTWEEENGETVKQYEPFREYNSWPDSIDNYGEFLNADERYSDIIGETNSEAAVEALANSEYATDSSYFDNISSAIETYSLTDWDNEVLNGNEGKIAIGAGHGGDGSTPGKRTPDDEYEWDFNNKVVLAAINVFEASGYEILRLDDETGKKDIELVTRTNRANEWGADIYISVHHNAFGEVWHEGTSGIETFTQEGSHPESENLAEIVHPLYVEAMGLPDRGVKKKNLHVTRETSMPAILTEGGFMDSLGDIEVMRDDGKLRQQGEAIAEGAIEYLGGISTDPGPDPEPDPPGDSISDIQIWLNSAYGAGLDEDGSFGPATKEAIIRGVQREINTQYNADIPVDGSFGPATKSAFLDMLRGTSGNLTKLIQAQMIGIGYDPQGFDGSFGPGLQSAVTTFQSNKGLKVDGVVGPETAEALFSSSGGTVPGDNLSDIQSWLNNAYNAGLDVDGSFGPATKEAIIRGVQTEINTQYNADIPVDGSFGPATKSVFLDIGRGVRGNLTRLIQAQMIGIGYNPQGFDGSFGPGLESAVRDFQSNEGLKVDGIVGPNTSEALFN